MQIDVPDGILDSHIELSKFLTDQLGRSTVILTPGCQDLAKRAIEAIAKSHDYTLTTAQIVNAIMMMQTPDDVNRAFGIILWEPETVQLTLSPDEQAEQDASNAVLDPDVQV